MRVHGFYLYYLVNLKFLPSGLFSNNFGNTIHIMTLPVHISTKTIRNAWGAHGLLFLESDTHTRRGLLLPLKTMGDRNPQTQIGDRLRVLKDVGILSKQCTFSGRLGGMTRATTSRPPSGATMFSALGTKQVYY